MNATTAEILIQSRTIDFGRTGNEKLTKEDLTHECIVEVDDPADSLFFSIVDFCMLLLVYLGPVVAFGCLVAPVVVRLLSMPVPR